MSALKILSFFLMIMMIGFNAAGQSDIRSRIDNMTREEIDKTMALDIFVRIVQVSVDKDRTTFSTFQFFKTY